MVTVLTVVISLMAGLAFRRSFRGQSVLFYTAVASLILPSIIVSLGIALEFQIIDENVKAVGDAYEVDAIQNSYRPLWASCHSGLGAHLTWTLPFGLLIMFAIFNRFNRAYEEAARDLGASPWQTFATCVVPIIAPSLVGVVALRLHPVLGRDRPLEPGGRRAATLCRSPCRA